MLSDYIFDADDPDAFVAEWLAQVGALHLGEQYNGFAFFDDEGRLLDMRISDSAEKGWLDDAYAHIDRGERGEAWLKDKIAACGATNVVVVHTHQSDEGPKGPCRDAVGMAQGVAEIAHDAGATMRAVFVLHNDELDGVIWAEVMHADESGLFNGLTADQVQAMAAAGIDPTTAMAAQPFAGIVDPTGDLVRLMPQIEGMAAKGDPFAVELAPILREILADVRAGRKPPIAKLDQAIRLVTKALLQIDREEQGEAQAKKRDDILKLPPFDPGRMNKGYMN